MTLTPTRQLGPNKPISLSEQKFQEIRKEYDRLLKLDKKQLEARAATISRVQLGWDSTVDKYSRINFILERTYGIRTLEAFYRLLEVAQKAEKAAKRKERKLSRAGMNKSEAELVAGIANRYYKSRGLERGQFEVNLHSPNRDIKTWRVVSFLPYSTQALISTYHEDERMETYMNAEPKFRNRRISVIEDAQSQGVAYHIRLIPRST